MITIIDKQPHQILFCCFGRIEPAAAQITRHKKKKIPKKNGSASAITRTPGPRQYNGETQVNVLKSARLWNTQII